MKNIKICIVIIFFVLIFTSCLGKKEENNKNYDVIIGSQPFYSSIIQSKLVKKILEEEGYTVEVKVLGEDKLWDKLKNNEINVMLSGWFYEGDYNKYKKIEREVVDLGVNCTNIRRGIVVPEYVPIADISELKLYQNKFDSKIYCFQKACLLNSIVDYANTEYDLNYHKMIHCESDIDCLLDKATKEKKWIAVAGYTPQWMMSKYNLRFLSDTKEIFGKKQESHTIANKKLEEMNKDIYNKLQGFYLYQKEMNDLLYSINESNSNDSDKVISNWIKSNEEIKDRIYQSKR